MSLCSSRCPCLDSREASYLDRSHLEESSLREALFPREALSLREASYLDILEALSRLEVLCLGKLGSLGSFPQEALFRREVSSRQEASYLDILEESSHLGELSLQEALSHQEVLFLDKLGS